MRWVLVGLLLMATAPLSVVLALYARWWWAGGRGHDGEAALLGAQLAAVAGEAVAVAQVAMQACRSGARLRHDVAGGRPDIVLLAGGPLAEAALTPLIERLGQSAWATTLFRPSSWRIAAADIAAELDTFLRPQGHRPDRVLIGYGNAGLILRHYLRRFPASGTRRVVTLATPHQGTAAPLIGFGLPAPPTAAALRQLTTGDRVPQQFDVIAIHSDGDEFIAPAANAYYPGAFNITVRGVGHFAFLRSQRLFDLLMENLGPPPATHAVPHQARASSMTDNTRARS